MERFDINKELKNLEGLSVRAKCSALDDLCCTLREAISDISNAKNEILEEYKRSCRKKFINEINSDIKANYDGRIPYRHDPCVLPRAVPVVEAMAAMVILDNYLLNKTDRKSVV